MRRVYIIFFCILQFLFVKAQDLSIISFKPNPMDLSASTHPRFDGNNDAGALVKVLFAEPNVKFEGNIIGVPEFKTNEYWVYLTQGTKLFVIKVPNAIPVQVSFIDHDLSPAQSKTTYELVLSRNEKTSTSQQKQTLTITFSPLNASVLVDKNILPAQNGKAVGIFPIGKHEVLIAAEGCESYEGTVTLKESSPCNINIQLSESGNIKNITNQSRNNNSTIVDDNSVKGRNEKDNTKQKENTIAGNRQSDRAGESEKNLLDKCNEGKRLYDKKDYQTAFKYFLECAEAGYVYGQIWTGFCYYYGYGVTIDYVEAVKWYRKAAEQGNADAQYKLVEFYYTGQGVAQDDSEAAKWCRRAAEQGNADAQWILGFFYSNGQGVPQNYAEALKWSHKAAEQGLVKAQYNLGLFYSEGQGVAQNYAEALKWYRKAAEQGLAEAQYNLGVFYANGRGVTQDYTEAVKWYRMAAEQNYADAQNNLGVCYKYGQGVAQDYTEAVKWYRMAAEQSDAIAQRNLGDCYRLGLGVSKNHGEAIKWYSKAAVQGDDTAKKRLAVLDITVFDEKGEGIIGSSILHTRNRAEINVSVSDLDGHASIDDFQVGDKLSVSFIGYKTHEAVFNELPSSMEYKVVLKE